MTPIQFTGDITIIPAALRPEPIGEDCRVGPFGKLLKRGEWLVIHQRRGIQVISNAEYERTQREVEETLYWRAA